MATDTRANLRAYLSYVSGIITAGAFAAIPASWLFPSLAIWPDAWNFPFDRVINSFFDLLTTPILFGISVQTIFRCTVPVLNAPILLLQSILQTGISSGYGDHAAEILPPLSWLGVSLATTVACHHARGLGLAALAATTCGFLLLFGLWDSIMVTLSQMIVAVPLGITIGFLGGLYLYRRPSRRPTILFLLDQAQTIPIFSYLVPLIIFFGLGGAPAVIAIVIFGAPPMVRSTALGLAEAEVRVGELGRSLGCSRSQFLWNVLVPTAWPRLQLGVNQVVMLSFSTVILAALIGAAGIGNDVLLALQRLALGAGLVAGAGITLIAILIDRYLQAISTHTHRQDRMPRRSFWIVMAACVLGPTLISFFYPPLAHFPESWTISTARHVDNVVDAVIGAIYGPLDALKTFLLLNILLPIRGALLALPWSFVTLLVIAAAWRTGGWRQAIFLGSLTIFLAVSGLWDRAVQTFYLCATGVLLSILIGAPLAILAGRSERVARVILPAVDTMQTMPAFIYLIPAVMLFGSGDVPSIFAIVCFAICPIIRYTEAAIRNVPVELREVGRQIGCSPWQLLWSIELPAATPQFLLGVSQSMLMALATVVVTALIGTTDLGHETILAISHANPGQALTAGFAIAAIGVVADRLVGGFARSRLGSKDI
ncbi:MAG: ABC transporter permease subunit [Hyphomicrobium sp.]|uniref:ABC transporter permease subunit n=1 Tax=Hyphomicrobium sp. TaxID=82 RepID=UPI0039E6D961